MDSIAYPLVAALAAIALAYKIPALLRDPRSPTRRALVAMLACLVWAPTVNTPVVYLAFDRLVGVPNLARLVAHAGILGFAVSVQILLLHWTVPQPARWRTWVRLASVVVAAAAMTVLFVLAPVDESTTEFTVRYGDAPHIDQYMMVYLGYFAVALVDIMRLSWRYARLTTRPFLRLGLRLVTVGAASGVVYCVEKAAYVAARRAGIELVPAPIQETLSPLLTGTGSLLMLIGFTIPSWGPRVAGAGTWLRRYRTYRRLSPLWFLVYQATPEIALHPSTGRPTIGAIRDLEYRLVRRVVEIRDGWLALRPYLDRRTADAARRLARDAGLDDDRTTAVVHAAVLTGACAAKARNAPPAEAYAEEPSGGRDIGQETEELSRVAAALRSPLVRAALADPGNRAHSAHSAPTVPEGSR